MNNQDIITMIQTVGLPSLIAIIFTWDKIKQTNALMKTVESLRDVVEENTQTLIKLMERIER